MDFKPFAVAIVLLSILIIPTAMAAVFDFGNYNMTNTNRSYFAMDTGDIAINVGTPSDTNALESWGWTKGGGDMTYSALRKFNGSLSIRSDDSENYYSANNVNGTNFTCAVKHQFDAPSGTWGSLIYMTDGANGAGNQIIGAGIRTGTSADKYTITLDAAGYADSGLSFNNVSTEWNDYVFYVSPTNLSIWINGVLAGSDMSVTNYNVGSIRLYLGYNTGFKSYVDDLYCWRGKPSERPQNSLSAPLLSPTVISVSPDDNMYNNNFNFTFKCNATKGTSTLTNITLWIYNSTENLLMQNMTNRLGDYNESEYSINLNYDDEYKYQCSATDSAGNTGYSANRTFWIDTVNPTITINDNNFFTDQNISRINSYNSTRGLLNVTFADETNLYAFQINITDAANTNKFTYANFTVNKATITHNATINFTTWPVGTYYINLTAADGHHYIGGYQIGDYKISQLLNKITFDTTEYNKISISCDGALSTSTDRATNSYTIDFNFIFPSTSRTCFIESDGAEITYIDNPKYNAWFVVYNKEKQQGNWVDFEGASSKYTVKKLSSTKYQIDFIDLTDDMKLSTKSIGGLNVWTRTYLFYRGNASNLFTTPILSNFNNDYRLNVTRDGTLIKDVNASVSYNGTAKTLSKSTGSNYILFSWNDNTPNTTGNYSVTYTINITQKDDSSFSFTNSKNQSVQLASANLTFYDEENRTMINYETLTAYFRGTTVIDKTTTTGSLVIADLTTGQYFIEAEGTTYTRRGVYLNVTNTTSYISHYLLQQKSGNADIDFYIRDMSQNNIEGARISVQRLYNLSYITIAQAESDYAGQTRIFLDQQNEYRLVIEKTGYPVKTITLRPILTSYVINLDSAEASSYTNSYEGVLYSLRPVQRSINQSGGWVNFTLDIYSSGSDLEYFGVYPNNHSFICNPVSCLTNVSGSGSGGTATVQLAANQTGKVFAHYYFKRSGYENQYINGKWFDIDLILWGNTNRSISSQFKAFGQGLGGTAAKSIVAGLGVTTLVASGAMFGVIGVGMLLIAVVGTIFFWYVGFIQPFVAIILVIWGVVIYVFTARDD